MSKIIFISNDKKEISRVKKMALESKYEFSSYSEDEWATFDDLDEHIQDEELSKNVVINLPVGMFPIFSLEEVEAEAIKTIVDRVSGNAAQAAKALKIGRATLYRKLDKHGLDLKQIRKNTREQKEFNKKSDNKNVIKMRKPQPLKKAS